ncbi:MAG: type II secretion system major pseudopilin GspG [Bdellovibrionales bacterium]|nr:type II secretion system major pseudopilin GspG [Bdellovibrionales bacterium]
MKLKRMFEVSSKTTAGEQGFTLTEMLIVIALIGGVMALVGTQLIGRYQRARVDSTKIQIKQLQTVLNQFQLDCGFFPDTDQGLDALAAKPTGRECKNYDPAGYVQGGRVPKDGFNNDFLYESDGRKYEIISLGGDGKEGGEGIDADISSNETE